ncbi:MAG: NUDIX hydrolase [Azospirillaceae bacterium]
MSREFPRRPVVGVGAVVVKPDTAGPRLLLVRRGKPPAQGQWSFPGGRQEWAETVSEAAVRETREETGVEIEPLDVLGVVDNIVDGVDGEVAFHYTIIDVVARWRSGTPLAADDVTDARWAGVEEALAMVTWEPAREVIAKAARWWRENAR